MACLTVKYTPVPKAVLTLAPVHEHSLKVTPQEKGTLAIVPSAKAVLAVSPKEKASLTVSPMPKATLTISQVCTISGGELCVLAGTDGPLRTRDGGYFLLDPARETDD